MVRLQHLEKNDEKTKEIMQQVTFISQQLLFFYSFHSNYCNIDDDDDDNDDNCGQSYPCTWFL